MPLLLMLTLLMGCMPVPWPKPPEGWGDLGAVAATGGLIVGLIAAPFTLASRVRGRLRLEPDAQAIALWYGRLRHVQFLAVLAGFVLCLYGLGWGAVVQRLCQVRRDGAVLLMPGAELLILAPLFAALLGSWVGFYRAEQALYQAFRSPHSQPFWPLAGYLLFQVRQNLLLPLVPVLLFSSSQGVLRFWPGLLAGPSGRLLSLAPMAAMLVLMPMVVRLLFGLRRLEPGPLRERLFATAERLGCRVSDVFLWDTRQGVANAMVVGVVPWLRYVLLTDRLVAELTPEEIEAVFGHELGHVRHRHAWTYLAFFVLSLTALGAAGEIATEAIRARPDWAAWFDRLEAEHSSWLVLPPVVLAGGYVFGVFGLLSRRCERQADVFGCRAASVDGRVTPAGIGAFVRALEKVAAVNGLVRRKGGWLAAWQHATVAQRVDFLERLRTDPSLEQRFERRLRAFKWALFTILIAVLIALGLGFGWEKLAIF